VPTLTHAVRPRATGVGVAFLVTLALFWPTVWSFAGTWSQGFMTHGWLIAGLVVWLLWRHRRDFLLGEGGDPLLLIPLAGLSLFWLAATVAHIQVFHQAAFALLLVVWGLVVFGRRPLKTVLLIGATFALALPIWGALSPVLQRLTTWMSGAMVKLAGIRAEIDGDLIHIPAGSFWVADGCAGTGFFVSALAIGALYAHLMVRGWRSQLAVLGVAAAMALVANWVRVGSIIIIGQVTEMQSGLIESHYGYGWLLFTVGLIPFFLVARRIEVRASRTAAPPRPAPAITGVHGRRLVRRAALATALAAFGPLLYFSIGALPAADPEASPFVAVAAGTGWGLATTAEPRPFSWQPIYQGAAAHETPSFTNGETRVYADRFIFRSQAVGSKLIGYPNRIADQWQVLDERVIGPVDPSGRRLVRQTVVASAEGPVLIWYWYRVGGSDAVYPVHAKILEIPAFLTRRRSAELVALSAQCEPIGCAAAFQALASFTGARIAPLPDPTGARIAPLPDPAPEDPPPQD
jgi:exosortase